MATGNADWQQRWQAVLMDNYGTPPIALVRGQGARVWDADGREYVDLVAGIAVNLLGHAHPRVVAAVSEQIATLGHTSNLVINGPAVRLAERLLSLTGRDGRVFFCNSGAEANEATFKLARLTGKQRVVVAEGSFHGRTMGALALTAQPAKQDPFRPLPGDVVAVPFGDLEALRAVVDDRVSAVFLEPVQGEGGVVPSPPGYLAGAAATTRSAGALLVLDEVQTGIGRTGSWFAHQNDGIEPDIVTLAKGLGGGLPIGAVMAFGAAATAFRPGMHGSTFGGNPVACAAALAVLDTIADEGLLDRAKTVGAALRDTVLALGHPLVTGVRGDGLLLGIMLAAPVAKHVEGAARAAGVLVNTVGPDIVRLAPPLVLTDDDVAVFVNALPAALDAASREVGS
ncbi:MAG: acetylornithine transaminase [Candidatus Nanopelagicales bacterium]